MITGLNHITLSVSDVDRSFHFYVDVLGCKPSARWDNGAYLTAGNTWIALLKSDAIAAVERPDYSHIAFSCAPEHFSDLATALAEAGCSAWSENKSEGDSYYFLDPDGHKLEIHVGDLESRLQTMRMDPWASFEFFE